MGHGTCSCCDELATIKADLESHKAASVGELYTRLRDGQKQMCERAERAEASALDWQQRFESDMDGDIAEQLAERDGLESERDHYRVAAAKERDRAERAEAEAAAMRSALEELLSESTDSMNISTHDGWQTVSAHVVLPKKTVEKVTAALSGDAGSSLLSEVQQWRKWTCENWGEWIGPCAHGRDPWSRCDECGELPAVVAHRNALLAEVERLRAATDCEDWADEEHACGKCLRCVAIDRDAQKARAEGLQNSLHTACGSCGTPTEPDIRICQKCLDAWIGGKGCEFLDKAQAPLRSRIEALENALVSMGAEKQADGSWRYPGPVEMRIEALEAALREFRPERKDEDSENSEECQECGNTYALRDDCSASAECDVCAHDILERGRAAARALLSAPATPLADDYSTDALLSAPAQSEEEVKP